MRLIRLLAVLVTGFMLGCSGTNPNAPATVSGSVTFKGAPVTGGSINFYKADGGLAGSGGIKADGSFLVTDVPTGEMLVTVDNENLNPATKEAPKGNSKNQYTGKTGQMTYTPDALKSGPKGNLTYVALPEKYRDKAKSDKKVTLKAGENKTTIALD